MTGDSLNLMSALSLNSSGYSTFPLQVEGYCDNQIPVWEALLSIVLGVPVGSLLFCGIDVFWSPQYVHGAPS